MSFNWQFASNDPLTAKLFDKKVDYDVAVKTAFADLIYQVTSPDIGKVAKSKLLTGPIKKHTHLQGKASRGDTVTFMNIAQLNQPGVYGDAVVSGTAEPIQSYSQSASIDQYAKELRSDGKLSEKRVVADFRETAQRLLTDSMAVFQDELINIALIGENVFTNPYKHFTSGGFSKTMGNALIPTDANHIVYAGNATSNATAANAANIVTAQLLTKLMITATQTLSIPIRELKLPSKADFLFVDDSNITAQLGYDSDWRTAQITGAPRSNTNEALTGSIGVYGGIEVVKQTRAFRPIANVAYGMLLGADALNILLAEPWSWFEGYTDNDRKKVVMISSMFGVVPTYFNNSKRNMLMVPHYVAS